MVLPSRASASSASVWDAFLNAASAQKSRVADSDVAPFNTRLDAGARLRSKAFYLAQLELPHLRRLHDGRADGMFGARLGRRGQSKQFLFGPRAEGHDVGEAGAAFGQRAGLVQHDDVHGLEALDRVAAFDEDALFSSLARRHHDRRRRGEAEGARAGDDEHRDRREQRVGERRSRPEQQPQPKRNDGDHEHDGGRRRPRRGRRGAGSGLCGPAPPAQAG